jgi:hypothetical protein
MLVDSSQQALRPSKCRYAKNSAITIITIQRVVVIFTNNIYNMTHTYIGLTSSVS